MRKTKRHKPSPQITSIWGGIQRNPSFVFGGVYRCELVQLFSPGSLRPVWKRNSPAILLTSSPASGKLKASCPWKTIFCIQDKAITI